MKRGIIAILFLTVLFFLYPLSAFSEEKTEKPAFTLGVNDKLISLQADNADFKDILTDLEKKTGIKVHILEGVPDQKVSLDVEALSVYAVHPLLERIGLENYAVVYDNQLASKVIYILPEGKDIAEVIKGKTVIKLAKSAEGNNINQHKELPLDGVRGEKMPPIKVESQVLSEYQDTKKKDKVGRRDYIRNLLSLNKAKVLGPQNKLILPPVDMNAIRAEDEKRYKESKIRQKRIGIVRSLEGMSLGQWSVVGPQSINGKEIIVLQQAIISPEATGMRLHFKNFSLPDGATL